MVSVPPRLAEVREPVFRFRIEGVLIRGEEIRVRIESMTIRADTVDVFDEAYTRRFWCANPVAEAMVAVAGDAGLAVERCASCRQGRVDGVRIFRRRQRPDP